MPSNDRPAPASVDALLRAARAGSREALGLLLNHFRGTLLRVATRHLPTNLRAKGGASDLVQETFLDAHRGFRRFAGESSDDLVAWLHCLLRHNFANFMRTYRGLKRRADMELPISPDGGARRAIWRNLSVSQTPSAEADRRERLASCRQVLSRVTAGDRELLRLRFEEQLSFQRIGATLQMSPDAARKRLTRLLRHLGDLLPRLRN